MLMRDAAWVVETLRAEEGLLLEVRGAVSGTVSSVTTDSRAAGGGAVFVALAGERFDGHDFVAVAYAQGAVLAVVERPADADIPQLLVRSSLEAYGALAARWRREAGFRILSVSGSNGKTTTTQMCAAILAAEWGERAAATRGNFNNEIGVARTLLAFEPPVTHAAVEAGMNHPGELARLADRIRPDVALLTNAQREHQEFLSGVRETAWENGLTIAALPETGFAVWPSDDACADVWASLARARGVRGLTFATAPGVPADARIEALSDARVRLTFSERAPGGAAQYEFDLPIAGEHNRHNAAGAALAARALGASDDAVVRALSEFRALKGRGAVTRVGSVTLYDEAYNANPDSMKAAMRILAETPAERRIFLMGDMAEVGDAGPECHAEVGAYARSLGLELWACGTLSRFAAEAYGAGARRLADRGELLRALSELPAANAAVTVKASRSMGLELAVEAYAARLEAERN